MIVNLKSQLTVAFISCHTSPQQYQNDASFIYRAQNLGLALRDLGHVANFKHMTALHRQATYHIIVLQRPQWNLRLAAWVTWLRRRGVKIWADFDDLVFDADYAAFSPAVITNKLPLKKIYKRFQAHQRALNLVDGVLVATEPLRAHGLSLRPDLRWFVLPNTVHGQWRQQYDKQPILKLDWENLLLSYFSGTASHDRDFALFEEPLQDFLHDHPQVHLQIVGPLQHKLTLPAKRLLHYPKQPFANYANYVQATWVNLMPLQATPFTRCKSALKVIEAAYWARPTLCTAIPDVKRLQERGAIETQAEQVYAQLQHLIQSDYYNTYTTGLRQRLLEVADTRVWAQQWLSTLND